MIYGIRHRTTYAYERPVGFARCVLRLVPEMSSRQTRLAAKIGITPHAASDLVAVGAFGEATRTVIIDQLHDRLVVEARSRVDVHAENAVAVDHCPWEAVSIAAFGSNALTPEGPANFLYPTRRTPASSGITDYARTSFGPGRPVAEAIAELMERIHADFTYDSEATTVSTPAATAFAARRGVCQDFAHIMIVALRGLGLPAAYVSGYLRTRPPPGQARLEGADATHAWVSVWCGARSGWVGFDPTNAVLALGDHIVLAVGRDYSDVAPVDGIILSPGEQTITVEVDVVPDDEATIDVAIATAAFGAENQCAATHHRAMLRKQISWLQPCRLGDEPMTVASILREKGNTIISVLPTTPLTELVATIASRRIGAVLVLDQGGELAGIVSERDVVKALAAKGPDLQQVTAGDVMTANVTTVTPATTINEAMELMDRGYFRHLPVLDGGTLLGIISVRDVVRTRIDRHVEENESLVSYINNRV